jgi:CheY-like chemotaxis protein
MSDSGALIYVVDDDVSAREGVAALIRSAGLTAKTFASAEEFLAAPRPETPSCLVLDVRLPGVSGLDLQQEIARVNLQIPIVFLTRRSRNQTGGSAPPGSLTSGMVRTPLPVSDNRGHEDVCRAPCCQDPRDAVVL